MTPSLGTFDVVTVPVHSNVRDAACASDDTISTDTSADSSRDVCDPVSKPPLVHAPGYTSFVSSRLWPGQHAGGVCFSGNALPKSSSSAPNCHYSPRDRVFPPPPP